MGMHEFFEKVIMREPLAYGTRVVYTHGFYRGLTATIIRYSHGKYLLSIDTANQEHWDTDLDFRVLQQEEV